MANSPLRRRPVGPTRAQILGMTALPEDRCHGPVIQTSGATAGASDSALSSSSSSWQCRTSRAPDRAASAAASRLPPAILPRALPCTGASRLRSRRMASAPGLVRHGRARCTKAVLTCRSAFAAAVGRRAEVWIAVTGSGRPAVDRACHSHPRPRVTQPRRHALGAGRYVQVPLLRAGRAHAGRRACLRPNLAMKGPAWRGVARSRSRVCSRRYTRKTADSLKRRIVASGNGPGTNEAELVQRRDNFGTITTPASRTLKSSMLRSPISAVPFYPSSHHLSDYDVFDYQGDTN